MSRLSPLVVVICLASLVACKESAPQAQGAPPPPPVVVAKPVVKEIVEVDDFTGRFEAVEQVDVRARVGGYLESATFLEGGLVKAGDVLFLIDKRAHEAALARVEAGANAARTRLEWARTELGRAEALARQGTVPERTLEDRRQQFQAAQADLAGAQAEVTEARLNVGYTTIRAPFSGRIGRKLVTEGNLVVANQTLLTEIVSLDPIHFYFDVDERTYLAYSRMAREGTRLSGRDNRFPVQITLADEKTPSHQGVLDFVDNRMDAATGTMRGRALVENRDHLLVPGLFGRIAVPGSGRYRGVLVPDEAIVADQDRRIVYLVNGEGVVEPRVIRPGPRIDGYRVVREGLTGDELVVVNGVQRVRFGRVAPQVTELPAAR